MVNAALFIFLLLGRDAMINESYKKKAFDLGLLVTESSTVHGYNGGKHGGSHNAREVPERLYVK